MSPVLSYGHTIIDLFENQASKNPSNLAIKDKTSTYTSKRDSQFCWCFMNMTYFRHAPYSSHSHIVNYGMPRTRAAATFRKPTPT